MSYFKQLIIHFQTSPQLPPPYAYRYTLTLTIVQNSLHSDLQLTYLRRDELDSDEIEAEGFTENDDYSWQGYLDNVWQETIEKLIQKTNWVRNESVSDDDDKDSLTIILDSEISAPKNSEEWLYLAQELLQAVFETSGRERPFELSMIENENGNKREVTLMASFKTRTAQIKQKHNGKSNVKFFSWVELPNLMEAIFAPDWLSDQASSVSPKKQGLFINLGDGLWHEWGKDVVEVGKKSQTLPKLKAFIDKLMA